MNVNTRSPACVAFLLIVCSLLGTAVATQEFSASRGDRTSGYLAQSRSEVLARNGMVATSQPLAAQAGLQILKNGGNAIDAGVATGLAIDVLETQFVGFGGVAPIMVYLADRDTVQVINRWRYARRRPAAPGRPPARRDGSAPPGRPPGERR